MVRKDHDKNTKSVDETAYRWIGSVCGAILGICVAALIAYATGSASIPMLVGMLTCGFAAGAYAGYHAPAMSDAILWIASLFT